MTEIVCYRSGSYQVFAPGSVVLLEDHPKFAADTYNPLAELAGLRTKLRLGDGGTLAIARVEGEARPAFGINPNWTSSDPVTGFKPLKSKLLERVNQHRAA